MLISIDPGVNHCGVAIWQNELPLRAHLMKAGLVKRKPNPRAERAEKWIGMARAVESYLRNSTVKWDFPFVTLSLVIETPQIYTRDKSKGDPNDLIDVAGVAGAIFGRLGEATWAPKPRDWKGQLPKEVTEIRVNEKLSREEKDMIDPVSASLKHNVLDAIHLGLVYLKR